MVRAISRFYRGAKPRAGLMLGFSGFPRQLIVPAAAKLATLIAKEAQREAALTRRLIFVRCIYSRQDASDEGECRFFARIVQFHQIIVNQVLFEVFEDGTPLE